MRKFRIGFYRVQKTYYEVEVEATNFIAAEKKFLRNDGKRFGGKKEIEIEEVEEIEKEKNEIY